MLQHYRHNHKQTLSLITIKQQQVQYAPKCSIFPIEAWNTITICECLCHHNLFNLNDIDSVFVFLVKHVIDLTIIFRFLKQTVFVFMLCLRDTPKCTSSQCPFILPTLFHSTDSSTHEHPVTSDNIFCAFPSSRVVSFVVYLLSCFSVLSISVYIFSTSCALAITDIIVIAVSQG